MKIQQDQNPEIHEAANELHWSRVIFENMRHQKSHTASGAVRESHVNEHKSILYMVNCSIAYMVNGCKRPI